MTRLIITVVAFFYMCVASTVSLMAQTVESVTVIIDASATQPIATGLIAESETEMIWFAEGGVRVPAGFPFSEGWFDPSGLARLRRGGQIFRDMPYGSVIGTFTGLQGGFYAGEFGLLRTQPVDIGHEFSLGLNMSDTDLSAMQGQFIVHVVKYPVSSVPLSTVRINSSSTVPVGTGLTAESDDSFLI